MKGPLMPTPDIGELRRLEREATEAPWEPVAAESRHHMSWIRNPAVGASTIALVGASDVETEQANVELICALRNAAPALLAGYEAKDAAYHERDMLVCALSKCFPSYLARHSDEDKTWENDWRWIVYIELPTGQASWHIHDSELDLFRHLLVRENNWDGHNTERKYQRLAALKYMPSMAMDHIAVAALKPRLALAEAVVTAACRLVAADTYKHPMLSRADAVKAGVAELHDAVGKWQGEQPAQRALSTYEGKSE